MSLLLDASNLFVDEIGNLNNEQRRSQISSGHRLLHLTNKKRFGLYTEEEFQGKTSHPRITSRLRQRNLA